MYCGLVRGSRILVQWVPPQSPPVGIEAAMVGLVCPRAVQRTLGGSCRLQVAALHPHPLRRGVGRAWQRTLWRGSPPPSPPTAIAIISQHQCDLSPAMVWG